MRGIREQAATEFAALNDWSLSKWFVIGTLVRGGVTVSGDDHSGPFETSDLFDHSLYFRERVSPHRAGGHRR
jgi:hypothetical protein